MNICVSYLHENWILDCLHVHIHQGLAFPRFEPHVVCLQNWNHLITHKDFKWYNTGYTWRFEQENLREEKCCAIMENKNTVHQRPQNDFHIIFDIYTFYVENGGSRFLQTSLLTYQIIWCHISNGRNLQT